MRYLEILIQCVGTQWYWFIIDPSEHDGAAEAYGCTPDYHQACECARIAWEQHSKGEA
jgi:hypothetical protein